MELNASSITDVVYAENLVTELISVEERITEKVKNQTSMIGTMIGKVINLEEDRVDTEEVVMGDRLKQSKYSLII